MSGNMSFSRIRNSTLLNTTNAVHLMDPIVAPTAPSNNFEEADLWSFRIILSSLQEIAFSNPPNPKIPPKLLISIQNTLIKIKSEYEQTNPFLKSPAYNSLDNSIDLGGADGYPESILGAGGSINNDLNLNATNTGNSISSDVQLVIRSMISIHIRNLAKGIISLYAPLLDKVEPSTAAAAANLDPSDPGAEEHQIQESLAGINSLLEKMKAQGDKLDSEIQDLKEQRVIEVQTYDHEIKEFEAIMTQLAEITLRENQPDKQAQYLDYMKKVNETLALKQAVLQLEQEIESNPPELMEELEEEFVKLQTAVNDLEKENEKIKTTLSKYEALGPDYQHLLTAYKKVEDDIKTKEWVRDQFQNVDLDKSLSESFY